jgi:regulator of replication initiation timing
MTMQELLHRLAQLETRVKEQDAEIARLRAEVAQLEAENRRLQTENRRLQGLLREKGERKKSKPPLFPNNYSVERNEPGDRKSLKKKKKRKPSTGRVPNSVKCDKADQTIDIHPNGVIRNDHVIHREQFAWRLIDGKAIYVRYLIHAPEDAEDVPSVPGVRSNRSEYGIEILLSLAFLVYWKNNSIDDACEILRYFTGLDLSKGQADSLLNQLAGDWESEYDTIARLIAVATILYIDETGWSLGKKHCYTWIFSTINEVFYEFGVGRGKDVLERILGKNFAGTGISDDYAAYDSIFAEHQLCWAHPLRKAIELALKCPENKGYGQFMRDLFDLYYEAVQLSKDKRLSVSRPQKAAELQEQLASLCVRANETVVTEKAFEKARRTDPNTIVTKTSEPEAKMIHLQKQLLEKRSNMFVFVTNTEVEPTNISSERLARPQANARKVGRTSKTGKGARRRGIIMTVFGTLKKRLAEFTLPSLTEVVTQSLAMGIALFSLVTVKLAPG